MYPFIHIANGLEIPTFFLVISTVLLIALFWLTKRAPKYDIPVQKALDLSMVLMAGSLIGSRLFHVLYENPEYYQAQPEKIFFLWDGGFVFFGGAFLAFFGTLGYFKFTRVQNRAIYFDAFAPVLALSYGLGRLGCFFAGCCYGRVCSFPWAVAGRHPTQLYALIWELVSLMILLLVESIPRQERIRFLRKQGDLFLLWVGLHSAGRILMESYRDDFRGETFLGLSISTFFSLLLILIVTFFFLRKNAAYETK